MDFNLFDYQQHRQNDGRVYIAYNVEHGIKPGHTHDVDWRQARFAFEDPGTYILAHFLGSIEEEQAIHNRLFADTANRPGSERKTRTGDRGALKRGIEWWEPTGYVVRYTLELLDRNDVTYIGGWNYNLVHTLLHTANEEHIRAAVDATWANRIRHIR